MPDDTSDRNHIQECARHQICDGRMVAVYEGLSDEDRMALFTFRLPVGRQE
jgi:hypothetical protein